MILKFSFNKKLTRVFLTIHYFLLCSIVSLFAQDEPISMKGIEVIIDKTGKTKNSYIFITTGYQFPAWTMVPMTPENSPELYKRSDMEVHIPGWFAGIGIIKKTQSRFEAGLLADYFKSTVPVAYSGQRSTSEWVYEQNNKLDYFTEVSENDINRVNEVLSFRGTIRYKIPFKFFSIWGGLTGGTFSNTVSFPGNTISPEPYRELSLGLTYQAGFDFLLKDSKARELINFTIYTDLSGPRIEEKIINLNSAGWRYINKEGNNAINPIRAGFALGLHLN